MSLQECLTKYLDVIEFKDTPNEYFCQLIISVQHKPKQEIVIHDDIWHHRKQQVYSRIQSLCGDTKRIHGRATKIVRLTQPELRDFLEANHITGAANSKHKYGLIHQHQLVAVASFNGPLKVTREGIPYNSYELVRFCNLSGYTVIGGLSKLMQHFIQAHHPDDIMTYVDREWSDGKSFINMGFEEIDTTSPQTFFVHKTSNIRYRAGQLPAEISPTELRQTTNRGNLKLLMRLK